MKTDKFSEWGIASVLPGAQYILDKMQEELNYLKQVLQAHQENREEGLRRVAQQVNREFGFDSKSGQFVEPKRRGRPPGVKDGRGQWRTPSGRLMTKEERSIEMKRRRAKWADPQAAARGQKKRWNSMTAAQQKKHIKKMVAAKVNGAAQEAASS